MPTFLKVGFRNFLPTLWNFPMTPSSHSLLLYGSPSWTGRTGKIVTHITYSAVLQYKDFHFRNRHSCHCVPINRLGTWSPKSCLQSAGEATLPFTAANAGPALSLHVFSSSPSSYSSAISWRTSTSLNLYEDADVNLVSCYPCSQEGCDLAKGRRSAQGREQSLFPRLILSSPQSLPFPCPFCQKTNVVPFFSFKHFVI